MQQRSLFDAPVHVLPILAVSPPSTPYIKRSETSRAAAVAIGGASKIMRERVLAFLAGCGPVGATDQELASGLEMLSDSCRARRCELRDRGEILDSGRRRPSPSGRASTVWIAAARHDVPAPWDADDQAYHTTRK